VPHGVPLAAVVTTSDFAQTFTQKFHFNAFAGNPVSCAAGNAVLETIEKEKIQENCCLVGDYLLKPPKELQREHEAIGDVCGSDLMIGVDLVKNRETKEPNPELTARIHEFSKDVGLLLGTLYGLNHHFASQQQMWVLLFKF